MLHIYFSLLHSILLTLISETLANTIFVNASATVILAPRAASINPLMGCSPIDVQEPVYKGLIERNI